MRTEYCGRLTLAHVGQTVDLAGWVRRCRDLGGITFVDLRDHTGVVQLLLPDDDPSLDIPRSLNREDVIAVTGVVARRSDENLNPGMATGEIEVRVRRLTVLNRSATPPFLVDGDGSDTTEETRLRFRYVDLRRERMQRSLRLRHRVFKATRDYFSDQGFLEIETPFLTKSTPEGARDFLVPSRNQLGSFYALPQSPQLFKQLFMIGGIDRYMQLVKCFRDEDLRHDRQPEFTQLDVEIAFPSEKDQIFAFVEGAMRRVFRDTLSVELQTPFPQLTQAEALARYGTDKPDLRYGMEIHDVSALVADCAFRVFSEAVASGGRVAGIAAKGCAGYSRAAIDRLQQAVVAAGASGLIWLRVQDSITSSIDKFLSEEERSSIVHAFDARAGDLILLVAGEAVEGPLSELRLVIVQQEHPANEEWRFVWVTDFPLFELDDDGRLTSSHHPFTSPRESDVSKLESEPLSVLSNAYDLVLNGTELASGSIRIHSRELQERILAVLGISKRDAELRFGFFLRALDYGAPPHGGFALGMDRLAMLIAGESSLRDVIAFPKTTTGACPLTDAPMPASEAQLNELGIYTHRERA